jgi:hypothetical protein
MFALSDVSIPSCFPVARRKAAVGSREQLHAV